MSDILALDPARNNNAQLMADCKTLGYPTPSSPTASTKHGASSKSAGGCSSNAKPNSPAAA